jgi:hypothetical protein
VCAANPATPVTVYASGGSVTVPDLSALGAAYASGTQLWITSTALTDVASMDDLATPAGGWGSLHGSFTSNPQQVPVLTP